MNENFKQLSDKYQEGYRCIYKDTTMGCTYTLRNFKTGKICTVSSQNQEEIGEINGYLEELEQVKKQTGGDCICTGYETDD